MSLLGQRFIKKRLQDRCFSVNIAKFLRRPILRNIGERLLSLQSISIMKVWELGMG